MSGKQTQDKSIKLKLTDEQKQELAKAFGDDIVKRLDSIDLQQIEGFVKADMVVN